MLNSNQIFFNILHHCFSFKNIFLIFKLFISTINPSWSLPIQHYNNRFPFLQQPSSILVPPGLSFITNGLPYQITVNDKKLEPKPMTIPAYVVNPINSPVTWISGSWGLNGRPINMQRWQRSNSKGSRPIHLG